MTQTICPDVSTPIIPATLHASGFAEAETNFHSPTLASDGRLYYVLSTKSMDHPGRVYRYDPAQNDLRLLGDLDHITGQTSSDGCKTVAQGKSHVPFVESEGKLYFATHVGFYAVDPDGRENPGLVPAGYQAFPGGHFVEYDLATGRFRSLARAPESQGIITFAMDRRRRRLYGLGWPRGLFFYYDLGSRDVRVLGPVCGEAELGLGDKWRCICRTFAMAQDTGMLYFTNPEGQILRFDPQRDALAPLEHVTLNRPILGQWCLHRHAELAYNWRTVVWHPGRRVFYGVHPRSGYLFEFDCRTPGKERLDLIDRICTAPLRRDGLFEPVLMGHLSLALDPVTDTIYYLTSDAGFTAQDGRRVERATHLVTYHLGSGRYQDHGVLRLADGRYTSRAQSLVRHPTGRLYACVWILPSQPDPADPEAHQMDLISFADPHGAPVAGAVPPAAPSW